MQNSFDTNLAFGFQSEPPNIGCYKIDSRRSGEKDIHAFAESRRRRRHRSSVSE